MLQPVFHGPDGSLLGVVDEIRHLEKPGERMQVKKKSKYINSLYYDEYMTYQTHTVMY